MTSRHQIKRTRKDGADPDYRIDGIGAPTGGPNGGPWYLPIDKAIEGIASGKWEFFVNVEGRSVDVVPMQHPRSKRWYLTTIADGFPPNNLLRLPDC